jgi:hypothetical protein
VPDTPICSALTRHTPPVPCGTVKGTGVNAGIGVLLTVDDVKATFEEKGTDGSDNSPTVGASDKENSEASVMRHADTPN